jgi:hypothetical protein
MALNTTDKDCLEALHDYLVKRKMKGLLTAEEDGHFASLKTGDETERVAAAKWYAETVALVRVQGALAGIDAQKAALQAKETELLAYIA